MAVKTLSCQLRVCRRFSVNEHVGDDNGPKCRCVDSLLKVDYTNSGTIKPLVEQDGAKMSIRTSVSFINFLFIIVLLIIPLTTSQAQDESGEEYILEFTPVIGSEYIYDLTTRGLSGESVIVNTERFSLLIENFWEGEYFVTANGERMPDNAPLSMRFQRDIYPRFEYTIAPDCTTITAMVQPFPSFYNIPILPETPVKVGDTWSGGPVDILPDMNVGAIPFEWQSTLTGTDIVKGQQCVVIETELTVALADGTVSYMPFLGVVEGDPTDEQIGAGALVAGVVEDSPAHEAGLEPGDLIIAAGDIRIRGWGGLEEIMPVIAPYHAVYFTIEREGEEFVYQVTPEAVPLANISASGGMAATCRFSIETGMPMKIELSSNDLIFTLEKSDGEIFERAVDFSYIYEYQRIVN